MSKKELIIMGIGLLVFVLAAGAIICTSGSEAASALPGSGYTTLADSEESRTAFLRQFGWEIEKEPVQVREITLPDAKDNAFMEYNELQKRQGFDLTGSCGQRVRLWTYRVTNHPAGGYVLASLVISDGKVIGGDISAAAVDGFSHGFDPVLFSAEIAGAQRQASSVDRTVPDSIPLQEDAPTEEELESPESELLQ